MVQAVQPYCSLRLTSLSPGYLANNILPTKKDFLGVISSVWRKKEGIPSGQFTIYASIVQNATNYNSINGIYGLNFQNNVHGPDETTTISSFKACSSVL
jgi:hypothetical protein